MWEKIKNLGKLIQGKEPESPKQPHELFPELKYWRKGDIIGTTGTFLGFADGRVCVQYQGDPEVCRYTPNYVRSNSCYHSYTNKQAKKRMLDESVMLALIDIENDSYNDFISALQEAQEKVIDQWRAENVDRILAPQEEEEIKGFGPARRRRNKRRSATSMTIDDIRQEVRKLFGDDADDHMGYDLDDEDGWSQERVTLLVNDVFFWGCADSEEVTEETLPALKQACTDVSAITGKHEDADILFCGTATEYTPTGVDVWVYR